MIFSHTLLFQRVFLFVFLFDSMALRADDLTSPELALDISLRYQTQAFDDSDASLWSTTISPYIIHNHWAVGLDIPYQRVDGVFNFRGTPQQEKNCDLLSEGKPLPPKLEPFRDRLLARCEAFIQEDRAEEGVGDINAYVSVGRQLANSEWYLMLTLGYDGDNADAERYLGSGTRDMYFDLVATQDQEDYSLSFLAGYNYLMGGTYEDFYDNYSYVGAEVSSARGRSWALGLGVDYQYDSIEPIASARLFGQWRANETLLFKVQTKTYESSIYYPNSSVDASLLLSF